MSARKLIGQNACSSTITDRPARALSHEVLEDLQRIGFEAIYRFAVRRIQGAIDRDLPREVDRIVGKAPVAMSEPIGVAANPRPEVVECVCHVPAGRGTRRSWWRARAVSPQQSVWPGGGVLAKPPPFFV